MSWRTGIPDSQYAQFESRLWPCCLDISLSLVSTFLVVYPILTYGVDVTLTAYIAPLSLGFGKGSSIKSRTSDRIVQGDQFAASPGWKVWFSLPTPASLVFPGVAASPWPSSNSSLR